MKRITTKAKKKRIIGYGGSGKYYIAARTKTGVSQASKRAVNAAFKKKPLTYMLGGVESRNIKPIYPKH